MVEIARDRQLTLVERMKPGQRIRDRVRLIAPHLRKSHAIGERCNIAMGQQAR
jgi:hypothetical protein